MGTALVCLIHLHLLTAMSVLFRKPQRISITVNHQLYQKLVASSDLQGRSISNLAAFLLENALETISGQTPSPQALSATGGVHRQGAFQPGSMLRR